MKSLLESDTSADALPQLIVIKTTNETDIQLVLIIIFTWMAETDGDTENDCLLDRHKTNW